MNKTDIPPKNILNKVGISVEKSGETVKFVFNNVKVIDDLKQFGFSLEVLQFSGGELTLPDLEVHLANQAALEAYWGAQCELARFKLETLEDEYNVWFEKLYAKRFKKLQDSGIAKPIQKEVEASISKFHSEDLLLKKSKLRTAEYNYRLLYNAIYTSIVTKGKMLQSLRNVIQGTGNGGIPLNITTKQNQIGGKVKV